MDHCPRRGNVYTLYVEPCRCMSARAALTAVARVYDNVPDPVTLVTGRIRESS